MIRDINTVFTEIEKVDTVEKLKDMVCSAVETAYRQGSEDALLAVDIKAVQEPYTEEEEVYELPDGSEVNFDEKEAYWKVKNYYGLHDESFRSGK
jgi:hypothetical protein